MRPLESHIGQPIRSLQTMLRVIAEDDENYVRIVPDGIYGPETVQAVSVFQRNHGLPVTGITDLSTWERIVAVYEPALVRQDEAQEITVILNPGQTIRKGESASILYLLQALLVVLSEAYESVSSPTMTGTLDEITSDSLAAFQLLSGLPATGELDKHTWKHIALQYQLAAEQNDTGKNNI